MRVPTRRGDFHGHAPDPHLTQPKYDELCAKLDHLKKVSRLRAMKEVATLAEGGDFSENAAYQIAKGRLRTINDRIHSLEEHLKQAIVIKASATGMIAIGSRVTLESDGKQTTFLILGSSESDPTQNIISYSSPLGMALLGKRIGESVSLSGPKPRLYIVQSIE